jgi:lipopolysaccharide export system protein LptA
MPNRSPSARMRYLTPWAAALVMALTLVTGLAQALPDDQDQPIHITADKALRDEKRGVTVYTGNVQMDQGSMRITADILTIYHVSEEADRIVAEGQPAKMQQQPELDEGLVYAHAAVIEYFRDEERVHLQSNARVEQDGSVVAGDSIDYFIAEQLVKADSDQTQDGNRVQVTIPPSTQPAENTPANETPGASSSPPSTTPAPTPIPTTDSNSGTTEQEDTTSVDPQPEAATTPADDQAEEDTRGAADSE